MKVLTDIINPAEHFCSYYMILENVSHHLSHQMCNGGKVCLVGEHPDIAPSQFVFCVMKYET